MKKTTTSIKPGRQNGFTLIEVMIAICIVGIGLMAMAKFQVAALGADKLAREQTEAAMWASNQAETLLSLPMTDPALATGDNGPLLVGENNKYSVRWKVDPDPLDPNTLVILITVSWDGSGQAKKLDFAYLKTSMM